MPFDTILLLYFFQLDIQSLKAQASITDIVSRYRPLVKAGANFKCLCPFHDDHKPSMHVNVSQNFAWCFACQSGGDVFSFVQKIEGVDFPDSVRIVGDICGVDTSFLETQDPKKTQEKRDEKDLLRELLLDTQKFFKEQFSKNFDAQKYVTQQRKFTTQTIESFGIGYAPDSFDALEKYLLTKKYSRADMLKAGVVSQKEGKETVYDKFRKRVMFPVFDPLGKIVGFGGRILGEGEPKYLNSPETPLYNKSNLLFGFEKAKKKMRDENMALLVEGNLDVMTCHEFGVNNAVGVSGVGFTDMQAKLLKRFCTRVTLALDSDNAGFQATMRILPVLFEQRFSVRIMDIPHGKDPDDALRENKQEFYDAVKNASSAVYMVTKRLIGSSQLETVEQKRGIMQKIFPIIIAQHEYINQKESLGILSPLINLSVEELHDSFHEYQRSASSFSKPKKEIKVKSSLEDDEFFWGLCFRFFGECEPVFRRFSSDFFLDENEKQLYQQIKNAYTDKRSFSMEFVQKLMGDDFLEKVQKSALLLEEKLGVLPLKQRREEIERFCVQYGKKLLATHLKIISVSLSTDSSSENIEKMQHFTTLLKQFH